MSLSVQLCHNSSPAEKIGKTLDAGVTITGCTLKDSTSILKPVVRVRSSDSGIITYNYMYISELQRYYFIDDIVSVNNNVWEISGHVDVLETFKNGILVQSAVIKRQEGKYNLFLDDPEFKTYNYEQIQTLKFPANTFSKTLKYVLVVNGS